jgi:cobalt ECF transporter T component CbiQ
VQGEAGEHGTAPDWLVRGEPGLCPCGCAGRRQRGSYVEKTVRGLSDALRRALGADDVAAQPGLLQRLDPRVKVASTLVLLVAAAFVRNLVVFVVLYGAVLAAAAASRVSVRAFVKRVWLFVPLFTGFVVLPATLNVVTHGHVVVPLGTWFGVRLGLTSQGLTAAARIVLRVAVSISLVVLVTLTTRWTDLLAGLRGLFVPKLFVQVLAMAYRYTFHLLDTVDDMYVARKARMVRSERDTKRARADVAASAGALFAKTHALSEEVHMAMIARGYRGETYTLRVPRVTAADLMWLGSCLALAATLIGVDRALH